MAGAHTSSLAEHVRLLGTGNRQFVNVFESLQEMLKAGGVSEVTVNGRQKYDFALFRGGRKPVVGMHDEIMNLAAFIKQAAQGGKADELAFVMIGEAGNGKTYLAEFLMDQYRRHTQQPGNERFTFRFKNLERFGNRFGRISTMESQTYEDPMVLALNLFPGRADTLRWFERAGLRGEALERALARHRPLGACSDFTWNVIRENAASMDDVDRFLAEHVEVIPVRVSPTSGVLTGKYAPKDKITASADDLLGKLDITRQLLLGDEGLEHPYRFNLRQGALARASGGGIHFADELFKNKEDLIKIYLGVIQNRVIEIDGMKWPMDTLILATSNHSEYQGFAANKVNAPVLDRCHPCYVGYCTHRGDQSNLTRYALGNTEAKTTFMGERFHTDPNLPALLSDAAGLTRLPDVEKLKRNDITMVDLLRLAGGEAAGGTATPAKLAEIISELGTKRDFRERFGMTGLSQRALERAIVILEGFEETNRDRCLHTDAGIKALEQAVRDDPVLEEEQKRRYIERDFQIAHALHLGRVSEAVFNAYRDDPAALTQHVLQYVNLVCALGDEKEDGKEFLYRDLGTGEHKRMKMDLKFVKAIDERMGIRNDQQRRTAHEQIRNAAIQRMMRGDRDYAFLDNKMLVDAVTQYVLNSDVNGASNLAGALAHLSNEQNKRLHSRMLDTMIGKLGYCDRCAIHSIEQYVAAQKPPA